MTKAGLRIRTSSRLHFGLLGWGAPAGRQFGGIGLMIESPGIELLVEPARTWGVEGPHSHRVEQVVANLEATMRKTGMTLPAARISVKSVAPEHVGLGVGTQLCLAVARAVLAVAGATDVSIEELARWTGRGRRSGIGLHGFEHGGLIVDGGRRNETDVPPLLVRLPFPETWSILVVRSPGESGLHGPDETRAFANLPPIPQPVTDSLCRLVLLEILPAVIEGDLDAFGSALGDLQTRVGACFAPAQGGIYSTKEGAQIVEHLRGLGYVGVGQSSWGPSLYAFSDRSEHDVKTSAEQIRQGFGLDENAVFVTRAANHGATLTSDE